MEIGIQISVVYTEEYLLQLRVSASNGIFAGQADIYAGLTDTSDFANILAGFPSRTDDMREFEMGSFDELFSGGAAKFRFYCVDSVGHSLAEVTLLHDPYRSGGSTDSALFSIAVESSAIDTFVEELRQMSAVVGNVARLYAAA